ncbi:MAG: bifunctional 4-hydroxy-2-oxoglutarate aldolase/2-dehydro-3-deoxy-phosphogluconate aldolase [Candidatus Protistobacter heckmanni]|nr:bifunctional 4-hydroxy-2-oxoglutarate aldolase/2-dehydro-3-deoxy-phosphogluconate aldolase [Candidatus Protistobacter heckmanni]
MSFPLPAFRSRVRPVIVLADAAQAVPLARALLAGGVDVMEITLRSEAGLKSIEAVAREVPQMQVGAGTVTRADEVRRVQEAGARFALSPGMTDALAEAVKQARMPFVPGVMTPGAVMRARDHGFSLLKLFPAAQAGGLGMLKALAGPFAELRFCPTGGVTQANLGEFLALPNVSLVGGSWLTPTELVNAGRWEEITALARAATEATSQT